MPGKRWTYNRLIELIKNTPLNLEWTEVDFNKNYKNANTSNLPIKHSCECIRNRCVRSLDRSIKKAKKKLNNNYCKNKERIYFGCGKLGQYCVQLNGTTFNDDKTKKYCPLCNNFIELKKFSSNSKYEFHSYCLNCVTLSNKKSREKTLQNRLTILLSTAKKSTRSRNSKGRKHNFNIDLEYLLELWKKCNGVCFRFKVKMSILDGDVWLVSLDRINPNKGYTKGNVQLVSWTYNRMKGKKTEEEMDKVFDQLRLVYSNTSL